MPDGEFTPEQMAALRKLAEHGPALLAMEENYQRASWLGRFVWKTAITVGATVAAVAAFKEQVISLWPWK